MLSFSFGVGGKDVGYSGGTLPKKWFCPWERATGDEDAAILK